MRRFIMILLVLILVVSSAGATSFNFDLNNITQDLLIEHRVFLTADTDDYAEIITLFYGHDSHKIYQLNIETLFDKRKGYTVDNLQSFDPESVIPGFRSMPFALMSVDETPKAVIVLISFTKLNDPDNLSLAVQNGIFTGSFPENYADVDTVISSLQGRELTMLEYADLGLHFDVK